MYQHLRFGIIYMIMSVHFYSLNTKFNQVTQGQDWFTVLHKKY